MAEIRELRHHFTPPGKRAHRHVHLESNVLFPRGIELDESCA
jgi:iron-sulfur cluster repair protein YtfE (RIC family)